jgi:pyrroline-5-carboxylate reductase
MFNKIGIIGIGRIGLAITNGFIAAGYQEKQLALLVKNKEQKKNLLQYNFSIYTNLCDLRDVDVLIIAIHHKDIPAILETIQVTFTNQAKPIISVAAQFTYQQFQQILGNNYPIFRVMLNIFVQINQGCLLFCSNPMFNHLNEAIEGLLTFLGKVFHVSEDNLIRSLCDFSSIPGVIIAKILLERINSVANSESYLTEMLLLTGLKGLIANIEHFSKENTMSIKQILELSLQQVFTPGGFSNAALTYLSDHNFWEVFKNSIAIYEKFSTKQAQLLN